MKTKKTILIDLDGVLNTYDGKYEEDYIPPLKDGAYDFVKELSKDFRIIIFTTRNSLIASKWIIKNNLDKYVANVTNVKEPAFLIIDDRCIGFEGDYGDLKEKIGKFEVWYKKNDRSSE